MDKDEIIFIVIVVAIIGGGLTVTWRGIPPTPPVRKFHVEGTVHFDTPPPSLSDDYSAEEGTVDHIGVYKYTTGETPYIYNYEKIGDIELEHFASGETTVHFEGNVPRVKNLCIGFLSGAPNPDDGYTRVEINGNTKDIELHYWEYIGSLPK